ncbi:NepR family anti-sigma factor [Rhodospira trueperi]|uniref:NepR family anti-sigma factor n=1 Tax=Rhodospira trueperi TaxID=69960 RepID=UPI003CCC2D3B
MSHTERNHGRSHWDQAAERKRVNGGGNGRADTGLTIGADAKRPPSPQGDQHVTSPQGDQHVTSPQGDQHVTSPDGDAGHGITTHLKRMYRERVEEPLPETFRSLVRRLRSANDTPSD